jgi:hypothetical protein
MKLILPLHAVPNGTTVRKATGEKPLLVSDQIKINQGRDNLPNVINADKGTRFLIGDNLSISAVSADTEVALWGTAEELLNFLTELQGRDGH